MNSKKFSEALSEFDSKYVDEAINYKRKQKPIWVKWGAIAACLCLVVTGIAVSQIPPNVFPDHGAGIDSRRNASRRD